jgi:hypothetical protein
MQCVVTTATEELVVFGLRGHRAERFDAAGKLVDHSKECPYMWPGWAYSPIRSAILGWYTGDSRYNEVLACPKKNRYSEKFVVLK